MVIDILELEKKGRSISLSVGSFFFEWKDMCKGNPFINIILQHVSAGNLELKSCTWGPFSSEPHNSNQVLILCLICISLGDAHQLPSREPAPLRSHDDINSMNLSNANTQLTMTGYSIEL